MSKNKNKQPNLIGISGKVGSGKDELAERLIKHMKNEYGISYENKKYAYNLKKIVSILAGVSMDDVLSRDGKLKYLPEWGMTIGEMQQLIGTEAIRNNIHTDAWVLSLFSRFDKSKDFWIITDVRFKNEARMIKEKGGIIIRLNGDPTKCRVNDNRNMNHISETDLDDYDGFDYIYDNIAPISNLDKFVERVSNELNYTHEKQ